MTSLLIAADGTQFFYTLRSLIDALVPIGLCVILPIIVVSLAMKTRRHELDKKTEVLLKAVENGAQLDPAFFENATKVGHKEKTVKDKLAGYLIAACITAGIGLLIALVSVIYMTLKVDLNPAVILVLLVPCAILLGIGIAFFIVYFVGKKKIWAKEIAELDA